MKKQTILIAAVIMLLGVVPDLFAQSQQISANATVVASFTYSNYSNVNFGNVKPTSKPSIDPSGNTTASGINSGSTSIGTLTITGTPGASINVTWTPGNAGGSSGSVKLSDGSGNSIDYNPVIIGDNTNTQSSGSTTLTNSSSQQLNLAPSSDLTNSGNYYLWIGGSLDHAGSTVGSGLSGETAGSYSGSLTITASYN